MKKFFKKERKSKGRGFIPKKRRHEIELIQIIFSAYDDKITRNAFRLGVGKETFSYSVKSGNGWNIYNKGFLRRTMLRLCEKGYFELRINEETNY